MTARGLVSVMIPVFNGRRTVLDTLESVRVQTYRPIEVVVINDGSEDGTEQLVEEWAKQWRSADFTVNIHSRENRGLLFSRNDGIRLSTGEYLQFLDADDILHPQKLATCVPYLERGQCDVVVPRTDKFVDTDEVQPRLGQSPALRVWGREELRKACVTRTFWHSVGPLFSRRIVKAAGDFPTDVHPVAEELEFHGRVKLTTQRIKYLSDVLNFYRKGNSESVTGDLVRLYEGRIAGAQTACQLLQSHGVRSWKEWSGVFEMCLRTYYQTVNVTNESRLEDHAWQGLQEAVRTWHPLLGGLCCLVPRPIVTQVMRRGYRVRMNNS